MNLILEHDSSAKNAAILQCFLLVQFWAGNSTYTILFIDPIDEVRVELTITFKNSET